jgi:hypothetical protein
LNIRWLKYPKIKNNFMCMVGGWVSYKKQELLTLPEYPGSSQFFHAGHLLVFYKNHPPSSQCFETDMIYQIYLYLKHWLLSGWYPRGLIHHQQWYRPSDCNKNVDIKFIAHDRNWRDNQERIFQRNWQHWVYKTQDEDKQKKTQSPPAVVSTQWLQ